jgi:LAGLIDADG endonuclease
MFGIISDMTDNATGADNQQERLIRLGWVIGFVDGEGCFSIGFVRQPNRLDRKGYKTGYQAVHRFVVTQGIKSISSLEDLRDFFGTGRIITNKRYDNHKEHLGQFIVNSREDLLERIIPFFEQYPLRTSKRHDFTKFAECVHRINRGEHKEIDGLVEIVQIVQTMNRQKPRESLLRILRDYMPDAVTAVKI